MPRQRSVRELSSGEPSAIENDPLALLSAPLRDWFSRDFPDGPTPAQSLAWPAIKSGENLLLVSPTGTGKTLAAFLAILDGLHREHAAGTLREGLRCVYISPLRSLGYDIERNLTGPLDAIRREIRLERSPVTVGVRTGDTSSSVRKGLRTRPPHVLITTPESLSLLLSQSAWHEIWRGVEHLILDEIHALVPTKRGADLMASAERLSARCARDPARVGLSATCNPAEPVAAFLVGPSRSCRVVVAPAPAGNKPPDLVVASLIRREEAHHRGLSYGRLLKKLRHDIGNNRTTIVFANTRALTEKITHDLRRTLDSGSASVAAHHSALDASRRREVESALKSGDMRAVVTSTSLELGVDIGTADLTSMVGLPGSTSRCLQRVGRAGHRVGAMTRGVIYAATAAELAGAVVTVEAALAGRVEPLRPINSPLDVLCQQLIGMASGDEWSADGAFDLLRRSAPFASLLRADFDACLDFLAGDLASPPGAFEPEPGAAPKWTAPRIWKSRGLFSVRNRRVIRWFWSNVGTITSEESVRVLVDGREIGSLEGNYAERLQAGDQFVLDGRTLKFGKLDGFTVIAQPSDGESELPRWSSDRQSLSADLAHALVAFREEAARLLTEGASALRAWLIEGHGLEPDAAGVLEDLLSAQEQLSEVPPRGGLLVEEWPGDEGFSYAFHVPLARSACEALGRAVSARMGRRFGRDLALAVADLGFTIRTPDAARICPGDLPALLDPRNLDDDILDGLDRGELLARRFRHVAGTAMMVLRRPDGGKTRVGGMLWVSNRLYPLVKASCPEHPLLRETRREVLEELLDSRAAIAWIESNPPIRFRSLDGPSPFAVAWIDASGAEALRFETPRDALRRLHARLVGTGGTPS
ncbi:MAG: Lhr-like helicase [Planctomycetota bacterium]|nr:Lhr-like helicase [Planctomycetota bacterium]